MSGAAEAGVSYESPGAFRARHRLRKRQARLYWRLERPRLPKYVRAVAGIVACRVLAAISASLAITLFAALGIAVGNLGYPRWPGIKSIEHSRVVSLAVVPVALQLSRWIPVLIVFGIILAAIPRPQLWIFRLTMLGALGFGYYQRHLPPVPSPAVTTYIMRKAAVSGRWINIHLPLYLNQVKPQSYVPAILFGAALLIAVLAHGFYRDAYSLSVRTLRFFPRPPRNRSHSVFSRLSQARRLTAVPVAAGLLLADLWLLQSVRSSLPNARYQAFITTHSQMSAAGWVLLVLVGAFVVCTPGPRGYRRLLITLLLVLIAAALSGYVYLVRLPGSTPGAGHDFWLLVIIYLVVTGFGFDLLTAWLDWPLRIPLFARTAGERIIPL